MADNRNKSSSSEDSDEQEMALLRKHKTYN